jgi:uncharacterized protein YggE
MTGDGAGLGRLVGLTVLALGVVVAGAGALATSTPAQVEPPPLIARTPPRDGASETVLAPDAVYLAVGVQTQGATAAEAARENDRVMAAVLKALRARGVGAEHLHTGILRTVPQHEPPRDGMPPALVGYEAVQDVRVTLPDLERAGELLDAALAAGANRVVGPSLGVRGPAALRPYHSPTPPQ